MRLHPWLMACSLAVLLPLLVVVSPVAAQSAPEASEPAAAPAASAPAGSPTDDAKKEASGRFRRGVELFQEGAYRAALVEFDKAYATAPDYRLLYNIGQTKLQLQDYLGATQSYERYLTEGGSEVSAARRDDVEKQLEALRERVGRIAITANKDGAEVFIDDLQVGVTPMSATVSVNVGQHRVYAKARDGATDTEVIDVAGGELKQVALELTTPEVAIVVGNQEEYQPLTGMQKGAIGAWAGAGVAVIGAVVLGVLAQGKADDLDKENGKVPASPTKVKNLRSDADNYAITSDVLSGLALAAAVTGTVLWFMDDGVENAPESGEAGKKEAKIQWGVGLGTVSARGHF